MIAALIFSIILTSVLGMIRLTEYFGVPPLIDLGFHTLAYDHLVLGPVITLVGLVNFDISVVLLKIV